MNNNNANIGCLGWVIVIIAILFAITFWQVSLVIIAIIAGIWWYNNKSDHAKQKQAEQAKANEKAQQERQERLDQYAHDNLKSLASKVDFVNLKPKEYLYYANADHLARWIETRTRTSRVNYGGLTGNIKIMKGVHYRTGSIKTDVQHEDYQKVIFEGYPLLTNRRIILYNKDTETAKAYPFTRILKATAYADGTMLSSESGKNVVIDGFENDDADRFNVYLQRLMSGEDVLPNNN